MLFPSSIWIFYLWFLASKCLFLKSLVYMLFKKSFLKCFHSRSIWHELQRGILCLSRCVSLKRCNFPAYILSFECSPICWCVSDSGFKVHFIHQSLSLQLSLDLGSILYILQGDIRTTTTVRFKIFSRSVLQCKLLTCKILGHSASVSTLISACIKQGPLFSFMKNSK